MRSLRRRQLKHIVVVSPRRRKVITLWFVDTLKTEPTITWSSLYPTRLVAYVGMIVVHLIRGVLDVSVKATLTIFVVKG